MEVDLNLIQNPTFDTLEGWHFHASGGGSAFADDGVAVITIDAPGDNIQLYQAGLALKPATRYRLSFTASGMRNLSIFVHRHAAPYESFGLRGYVAELADEPRRFETYFTTPAAGDLSDGRLRFWFAPFGLAGTKYWIEGVELVEAGPEPVPGVTGRRVVHVIAQRLDPGDVLDVRYVEPGRIVLDGTDIDWDATPWKLVAMYAPDTD